MLLIKRVNPVKILFLLLLISAFAQDPPSFADYYKYMDNKGTICITNNLNSVPRKYRSNMKIVHEEMPAKAKNGNQPQTPSVGISAPGAPSVPVAGTTDTSPRSDSRFALLTARFPWIKPLLGIAAIVAAFLVLFKLRPLIPSPQLARLLTLAIFLAIFVFSYKLYADYLVDGYFTVKAKILGMFARSNTREAPEPGAGSRDTLENQLK